MRAFVFFISLLFSLSAASKASLDIGYTNFPPFIWEDSGKAKGIYVDVLTEAIENRMDTPLHFRLLPRKRILGQLEAGRIDGIVDISSPELLGISVKGNVPVAVGIGGAFTYKQNSKLSALNAIDAVEELKAHQLLSYQGDDWANNNLDPQHVDSGAKDISAALYKLARKRGDIFIQVEQIAHHYINMLNIENDIVQLRNFSTPPYLYQLHLSKKSAKIEVLPQLDSILTMMINDGSIDRIYKHYHSDRDISHHFTDKNNPLTTQLVHYWSGAMQSGMSDLMERFNDTTSLHKLKTTAMDHESFKQAIKLMLFGESHADIYSNWAGERTQFLVDTGNLEPIDDIWQAASLDNYFSPVVEQACTYNQKKYAIPVTQHLAVFFYNKHIFKKYGLEAPKSWSEFLTLGDKLIENGITPVALGSKEKWPAQFWFDYLLLRTAGPEYREKLMKGKAGYTDEQVKRVYALWKELIDKGFINDEPNQVTWTEAAKQVKEEKSAMTLMGTWLIQYFESEFKWQENSDYGFFVFPRIDSNVPDVTVGPIDLMVQVKGRNDAATKQAMLFFAELESQKILSSGSGSLAPNVNIPKSFYSPMKQSLLNVSRSTDHWAFNYDLATPPVVSEIGLSSFTQFLENPEKYNLMLEQVQKEVEQYYKNLEK